jgi:arabinogalactan oligomer/maltooligosaccharide transport system permease protein
MLTTPLCLAAALGFRPTIWEPMSSWFRDERLKPQRPRLDPVNRNLYKRESRIALPWIIPGAVILFLLSGFPLIYQGAMSLTDFNTISIRDGIQGGVWREVVEGFTGKSKPLGLDAFGDGTRSKEVRFVGPAIYLELLAGRTSDVMGFNFIWVVVSVGVQTLLGMGVALLLQRNRVRWRGMWRTIFILPWAIPEFVGALIWYRIFEPRFGWLALASNLPAGIQVSWFQDLNQLFLVLLIAATWYGFPFIMLAATAGLKQIPDESYDAAAIDGAAGVSLFRYITWPLLIPLVIPAVIIRAIAAFNQFYLFYTMRSQLITYATLSYFIFSPNSGGQFAVSAAINIFTVLVLIGLLGWFNRLSKATEGLTYA